MLKDDQENIIIKSVINILSKFFNYWGYDISRTSGKSTNPNDEFFQIKRFLSDEREITVFDVGAHTGKLTKIYRNIFPYSQIFAFEPLPDCFKTLSELSVLDKNINSYELAVSSKSEKREFIIAENPGSSSLLKSSPQGKNYWGSKTLGSIAKIKVKCTSLDDFCQKNKIQMIHLLKLDIQGFELEALKGAEQLLKMGNIGIVYTEISIINAYEGQGSIHEIISYLNKFNFELFNIYKALRKKGRLLEIDAMFVRKDMLHEN